MRGHYFVFTAIVAIAFIVATDKTKAKTASQEDLMTLEKKEFTIRSENEKKAFNKFFRQIEQGKIADYRPQATDPWTSEILTNPVYSKLWDKEDRTVDSHWLVWLCRNKKASKHVPPNGINIAGAMIAGEINLESVRIAFPIRMSQCAFDEPIILRSGHIVSLDMGGLLHSA